ncbi:2636_t:CDS:2, partial [Dentiscutata heterogama]
SSLLVSLFFVVGVVHFGSFVVFGTSPFVVFVLVLCLVMELATASLKLTLLRVFG